MPQLLKHYMVNRDNLEYIIDEPYGYMYPQLPELQIVHILSKDNGVLYCLSTCADEVDGQPYTVPQTQGEGMKVITQTEWDNEISTFDNKQLIKRYDILRSLRDKMLQLTDWIVIKDVEQEQPISIDLKTWRQELRDLPNSNTFPISFPTLPTLLQSNIEIQGLYTRFNEVREIPMINDPLPPRDGPTPAGRG
jgi:hypothetical protein